jgi:ATP-dependent protease HslVU (ClpYQ) peptidase subunit
MTCIVALEDQGTIYMGADSAAIEGDAISLRTAPKIFKTGKFLIGYCNSFRYGQIIQHYFKPPPIQDKDILKYMITKFVPELQRILENNGYEEKDSSIIIGYDGNIFYVESDWQVGQDMTNYHAIGSGSPYALGSLYSTSGEPLRRIEQALEAAEKFSTTVRSPFNYLSI